jgi:hypothetical protein
VHKHPVIAASIALVLALAGLVGPGCATSNRPNQLGGLFMPAVYTAAGDTGSAASSLAIRKALDRRTWLAAGETSRAVGRKAADGSYGFFLLVSCLLPDWSGGMASDGYGETYGD